MKHVIKNFTPLDGKHCITTSILQIMRYNNIDISEEMIFGLGSGLNWFYMESVVSSTPMISARTKPILFEEQLSKVLNINCTVQKTINTKKAYIELKKLIESNIPVMIYVDMAYLKYLGLPSNAHFGGHSIVVFGIDENKSLSYISDRDSTNNPLNKNQKGLDYHLVPLNELEIARNSKSQPFPARNKWVEFNFSSMKNISLSMIKKSLEITIDNMLNVKSSNLGIKGIKKFSEKIKNWDKLNDKTLYFSAMHCYHMIDKSGGTGGGAFRLMFSDFLLECSEKFNDSNFKVFSDNYKDIGMLWERVSQELLNLSKTKDRSLLRLISQILSNIAILEEKALISMSTYMSTLKEKN